MTDTPSSPVPTRPDSRLGIVPLCLAALPCLAGCEAGTALPAIPAGPGILFTRVVSGDVVSDSYSSPSASWIDLDGDGDEDLYGHVEAHPPS